MCKSNFGKRSHHTIFHIWLMFGPFGLFWRCVGFYLIDLGVSISLRSGLRFWTVYFLSRGHGACANPLFICRSCMCRLGRRWNHIAFILIQFRPGWHHTWLILSNFWLFSGICCFYFGLGHFLVVEVWSRWPGFWSWAFQGCWVLALFVFTLDLGHFSVVKFWVLAQRCQRKQYIHTKNCNSLLAALLMF